MSSRIFCNDCDTRLPDSFAREPGDQRTPCPDCGSTSRRHVESVTERVSLKDSVTLSILRDEAPVLFSWARRRQVLQLQPSLKWTTRTTGLAAALAGLLLDGPTGAVIGWAVGEWIVPYVGRVIYRKLGGAPLSPSDSEER